MHCTVVPAGRIHEGVGLLLLDGEGNHTLWKAAAWQKGMFSRCQHNLLPVLYQF